MSNLYDTLILEMFVKKALLLLGKVNFLRLPKSGISKVN
jgi:hypothetical protein